MPTLPRPNLVLSEKQWQSVVIEFATLNGWWSHHEHDSRRSSEGWPDLVLLREGEAIFVELKTESGKVTAAQTRVLELLDGAGCEARVWRPSDRPAAFARLGRRRS